MNLRPPGYEFQKRRFASFRNVQKITVSRYFLSCPFYLVVRHNSTFCIVVEFLLNSKRPHKRDRKAAQRLPDGFSFERKLLENGWLVCSTLVEFFFCFRQPLAAFPCVLLIKDEVQSSFRCPAVSLIHPIVQPSALLLFLVCLFWNGRHYAPSVTICSTSAMIFFNSSGVGVLLSHRTQ